MLGIAMCVAGSLCLLVGLAIIARYERAGTVALLAGCSLMWTSFWVEFL